MSRCHANLTGVRVVYRVSGISLITRVITLYRVAPRVAPRVSTLGNHQVWKAWLSYSQVNKNIGDISSQVNTNIGDISANTEIHKFEIQHVHLNTIGSLR